MKTIRHIAACLLAALFALQAHAAADVASSLKDWSTTASSNAPSGSTAIGPNLDDNLREMQAVVRQLASTATVASASTTDIGANNSTWLTISGTTTITGFGTVSAGIFKWLVFDGALTLTHNATSLILPTASNITTAAGDTALMLSLGSGNWRCITFQRKSAVLPASLTSGKFLTNNGTTLSWGDPSVTLNNVASATGTATLANGANLQIWGWTGALGSNNTAFTIDGAGTSGSSTTLLKVKSGTGSVTNVFRVEGRDNSLTITPGNATAGGSLTYSGGTRTEVGNGGAISLTAQTAGAGSGGNGGDVTISAGGGDGAGNGGITTITGSNTGTTKGYVDIYTNQSVARVQVDPTQVQISGTGKTVLNQKHIYVDNSNGAPTISAGGGTGATIAGSDVAFEVTAGTGSPTSVTVAFANAWASAPQIVVCGTTQAGVRMNYAANTTQVQILTDSAWSSGTKVSCMLMGLQ